MDTTVDTNDNNTFMTKQQVKEISRHAGHAAAHEILTAIGIDASSPEAMIQAQVDFAHLRRSRRSAESIRQHSLKAVVGTTTVGFLTVLWMTLGKGP